MSKLPKSIATSEIDLGGFIMRVHQLDNGQRVINSDDIERFFLGEFELNPENAIKLAQLIKENQYPFTVKPPKQSKTKEQK